MRTDVQGCSTCPAGEERYEKFTAKIGRERVTRYQYDYRHPNGQLFSTFSRTLERCREKRDEWMKTIQLPLNIKNMAAKAIFNSTDGSVRLVLSNGVTKRFESVSKMLGYCEQNGITIKVGDCVAE